MWKGNETCPFVHTRSYTYLSHNPYVLQLLVTAITFHFTWYIFILEHFLLLSLSLARKTRGMRNHLANEKWWLNNWQWSCPTIQPYVKLGHNKLGDRSSFTFNSVLHFLPLSCYSFLSSSYVAWSCLLTRTLETASSKDWRVHRFKLPFFFEIHLKNLQKNRAAPLRPIALQRPSQRQHHQILRARTLKKSQGTVQCSLSQ